MTIREVILHYLDCIQQRQENPDAELYAARAKFQEVFYQDYGQRAECFWIRNHADEVGALMDQPSDQLTLRETLVCLTNIVARDRIYGAISGCEESGQMAALLMRYLELTKEDAE